MIKNTLLLLVLTIFFLTGCQKDDDNSEISYPLKTVYQELEKNNIEVWTKTNGNPISVPLDETGLDNDEFFTIDINESIPAASFNFISETEVNIIIDYGSALDTFSVEYTNANNQLVFPYLGVTVQGSPKSFKIKAQAYLKTSTSGGVSITQGSIRVSSGTLEDIESLKDQLEEGETIAVLDYSYNYSD